LKKRVSDWSTTVEIKDEEAEAICKLKQGESCCAFLVMASTGFECIRMDYPTNKIIFDRLKEGTMNAKGKGGWSGCAWEELSK
jgi:hypothetical protein